MTLPDRLYVREWGNDARSVEDEPREGAAAYARVEPVAYVSVDTLLQFIASLTLGDHMGDVANDIVDVLKKIGHKVEWETLDELGSKLGAAGVTTLRGTSMADDEDDEDDDGGP